MSNLTDKTLIRLLLGKFGPQEHSQYLRYVLPKDPTEYTYNQTIAKLKTYLEDHLPYSTTDSSV